MYYENANKLTNIWRDGDIIHVFVTVYSEKQYRQFSKTIDYVKRILGLNFDYEYDGQEIYFPLSDFNELDEFREYFYRYLDSFKGN